MRYHDGSAHHQGHRNCLVEFVPVRAGRRIPRKDGSWAGSPIGGRKRGQFITVGYRGLTFRSSKKEKTRHPRVFSGCGISTRGLSHFPLGRGRAVLPLQPGHYGPQAISQYGPGSWVTFENRHPETPSRNPIPAPGFVPGQRNGRSLDIQISCQRTGNRFKAGKTDSYYLDKREK